jgi:flagellar hook protein FlgE
MSFSTSMSGLNGAQTELATMANNIANVSTDGFKRSRVNFGDILASSPMSNPAKLIGSGTYVKSVAQEFQQGAIEATDSTLDLAISGQGFFTVKAGKGDTQTSFTRNGTFGVDADRYIVDSAGRRLQLFPTTTDGSVLTTDIGSTIAARLPLTMGVAKPTSLINLAVNLPAGATIIPDQPIYTATNPYVFDRNDPATFNASTSTTIFDSQGNPVPASVYYVKTAAPGGATTTHDWTARVFVGPTELQVGGASGVAMHFDTDGNLVDPTAPTTFDPFTLPGNSIASTLTLDHGIATTQIAGPFNPISVEQDGAGVSQLESVAIDGSGALRASYSAGEIVTMGKVAIANFANSQGLKPLGDASYLASPDSGLAIMGEAGRNGMGSIRSGSLERSNVDLTAELVGLISAQRNFQANAKAMETDSSLLQTIINMRQ